MSIEKRGTNSWRVQTQIKDADGHFRWVRKTIRMSPNLSEKQQLRQARIAEAKLIDEAENMTIVSTAPTLRAFGDLFIRRQCADASPTTVERYMNILDTHIIPYIGDLHLDDITPEHLNRWMDELYKKNLSRSTIRMEYGFLLNVLNTAVKWDYLSNNPMQKIDRPKAQQRDTNSLTEEQFRHLITELQKEPHAGHRCGVLLAVMCGLRISEICALRTTDVDFENHEIYVHAANKYTAITGKVVQGTKTKASRRKIVVPDIAMDALKDCCDEIDYLSKSIYHNPKANFIIHNTDGWGQSNDSLRKWWRSFANRIGLAGTRFHDLRHTHASLLIANGIDVVTVAKRLGHSNTTTTLQTYAHALSRRDTDSANIIQAIAKNNLNTEKK